AISEKPGEGSSSSREGPLTRLAFRFAHARHPLPQGERVSAHRGGYWCSFCISPRIASPICDVEAAFDPADLMSAVRSPLAGTAAIAASSLSASAPMSKE